MQASHSALFPHINTCKFMAQVTGNIGSHPNECITDINCHYLSLVLSTSMLENVHSRLFTPSKWQACESLYVILIILYLTC